MRAAGALTAAAVPLALGASFYVFLRPHEAWLVAPLLRWSPIASARVVTVEIGASLPSIVLGSAPDLAWGGALGALLAATSAAKRRRWFLVGLVLAAGYELLQLVKLLPGTWDAADLGAQVLGYVAGFAIRGTSDVATGASTAAPPSTSGAAA